MSLSLEDARALERLSERTGRSLMVGHILEYHPAIAELRRRIARGELGEVRLIVSERLGPSQSRHENAWWSLAPHDLSVLRHLTGAEPLRVQVRGERDVAVGRVEASGGLVALVHASFAAGDKIRRITVVGTRAGAVFEDGARPSLRTFSLDRGVERALELARAFSPPEALGRGSLDGVAPAAWLPGGGSPIPIEPREPLMCEAEHFVEAVLDRAPIRSDAESGRRVVAALEAGQRSLASGGSIEDVPRR
jgi:predicted dehydrogenase